MGRLRRTAGRHRRPDPPRGQGRLGGCGRSSCSRPATAPRPHRRAARAVAVQRHSTQPSPHPHEETPTERPTRGGPAARPPPRLPARPHAQGLRPTRIVRQGLLGTADAYTRHAVTYRSGDVTVSGVLLVHGQGTVPRDRPQPRLHRAVDRRHRPGPRPRAGLARSGRASSCYTATTAATRAPTPPAADREAGSGTPRTRSTPSVPCARSRTSTPTGWPCSDGRWVAASPSTRSSPGPGWSTRPWSTRRSAALPRQPQPLHGPEPPRGRAQAMFDRFGTPPRSRRSSTATSHPHVLRPDHRAGAHAPRHRRRVLPVPVGGPPPTACSGRPGWTARLEVYQGEMHSFVPRWQLHSSAPCCSCGPPARHLRPGAGAQGGVRRGNDGGRPEHGIRARRASPLRQAGGVPAAPAGPTGFEGRGAIAASRNRCPSDRTGRGAGSTSRMALNVAGSAAWVRGHRRLLAERPGSWEACSYSSREPWVRAKRRDTASRINTST